MQSLSREAIGRIKAAVGDAHVQDSPTEVESHSRDTSCWRKVCAAVVYPATAQEVAQILRIASECKMPVWPFSKGKNWGYGAAQGLHEGALILMLDRMNRIVEVNEELAYAVIEPGVTQKQLNDYLKERKSKLWADCTDSTTAGSVIGNALERGVGYTPYWDHFAHLCGLEVVLASGEVMRTGGGPENSSTWHTYKWGTGPYVEGLFSQSNFGVVTQAGVWLMPEPEAFGCFICELDDERNLPAAVDSIRRLALDRVLQSNVHLVNDVMFAAQMIQYPYELRGRDAYLSEEARQTLRARLKIAPWTISGGLYSSRGQVQINKCLVKKELSKWGRITFLNDTTFRLAQGLLGFWKKHAENRFLSALLRAFTGASIEKLQVIPHIYPILKGIPGDDIVGFAYFKTHQPRPTSDIDPARDGAGLIWMAVVTPLTGTHVNALKQLCAPLFHKHGLDWSCTFIMVNARSALGLLEIFFDKTNPAEGVRAQALYEELAFETVRKGYQQYRTSVGLGSHIMEGTPVLQRMLDSMKTAMDPQNILAPGRYGLGLH